MLLNVASYMSGWHTTRLAVTKLISVNVSVAGVAPWNMYREVVLDFKFRI